MLLGQPYPSACQLAVLLMDRLLLQTSESSVHPDHSRHHPVALGKSWASLVQGEERTGFPHPSVAWKVLDKKGLERRRFRRREKEWPACACRRSRMKTKPHSIWSRHILWPRNVPGSGALRLDSSLQISGSVLFVRPKSPGESFPLHILYQQFQNCNSDHLRHHYD